MSGHIPYSVADPNRQIRGGGGGGATKLGAPGEKKFSGLRASLWSKNNGGDPEAPGPYPGSATNIDSVK